MKTKLTFILMLTFISISVYAQNSWTSKSPFAKGLAGSARSGAAGFYIQSTGKVYIGTGLISSTSASNDFWAWDPTTNVWTQKQSFQGAARYGAVGFSIGNKGYIGTGAVGSFSKTYYNDFWEYDPLTDNWAKKTSIPGNRAWAVGFSIGNKGYIGTGYNYPNYYNDFYEYDPTTDSWSQKLNLKDQQGKMLLAFHLEQKGILEQEM